LVSTGAVVTWASQQWQIVDATPTEIVLSGEGADPFSMTRSAFDALVRQGSIVLRLAPTPTAFTAGAALLDQARAVDLATAVFRNRIINPEQYADEVQAQLTTRAAAAPGGKPTGKRRTAMVAA
jgi:hypothetical protein